MLEVLRNLRHRVAKETVLDVLKVSRVKGTRLPQMERSPRSVLPFSLKAYDCLRIDNIGIVASLDIPNSSASLLRDLSLPVENLVVSGAA